MAIDLFGQRQPACTPQATAACVQRQTLGLGLGFVVQPVRMGRLSKCLVVEHGFLPLAGSTAD
jgi:hypothetical protein